MPKATAGPDRVQCYICRDWCVIRRRFGQPYKSDPDTGELHVCNEDPATKRRQATVAAIQRSMERKK
jgi:hypothetical protein